MSWCWCRHSCTALEQPSPRFPDSHGPHNAEASTDSGYTRSTMWRTGISGEQNFFIFLLKHLDHISHFSLYILCLSRVSIFFFFFFGAIMEVPKLKNYKLRERIPLHLKYLQFDLLRVIDFLILIEF